MHWRRATSGTRWWSHQLGCLLLSPRACVEVIDIRPRWYGLLHATSPGGILLSNDAHMGGPLRTGRRVRLAIGLAGATFGLLALSGPGRIDIVDGQTRYEVSRSIVDYSDLQIRNPDVWFGVFPGRQGQRHTYYRLPQSLAGVPALVLADLTGPSTEPRRHFSFVLASAAAAGVLASVYFFWFLATGLSARHAVLWAVAGILCTPNWFYGTSTFDDIFGSLALTSAMALALATRHSGRRGLALGVGLLVGLAFNCKQPLGIFALAAVAGFDAPSLPTSERLKRAAMVSTGVLAGVTFGTVADLWKFPPGTQEQHLELLKQYYPAFTGFSWIAPFALMFSPAAGALWYFPPVLLCIAGVKRFVVQYRRGAYAFLLSVAIFFAFICSISFSKGDPAWGPRYLTPIFAVSWLFAPGGAARFRNAEISTLLVLGAVVQLLALTVDPYRLYIKRSLPSTFGAQAPLLYFDPANSHLLNRPRELSQIWKARREAGLAFAPWDPPSATETILDRVELGQDAVRKYKILNSYRPWWLSHWYIPEDRRPVSIERTAAVFVAVFLGGVWLVLSGLKVSDLAQDRSIRGGASL